MARLRRARPVRRPIGKRVALEDDDLLEMIRQRPGRGQSRDPGANHDGLAGNCSRSHDVSRSIPFPFGGFSLSKYYQNFRGAVLLLAQVAHRRVPPHAGIRQRTGMSS
jgi:hypothetical protein